MKIDLHIHSIYSDGCCSPELIASRAKALGLSGFALTDHDSVKGWGRGKRAARELGLEFVAGKEIVIREKPRIKGKKGKKIGEILALFLDEDITVKREDQTPSNIGEIIDQIHERNGIVSIPHPFASLFRTQRILEYMNNKKIRFDAIESINGRCNSQENNLSIRYALENKLPQIGGSDAHTLNEIGSVYTFAEADSLEEFKKLIKKGLGKPIGIQKTDTEINMNRIYGRITMIFKKRI